jgi:hypothetical protein
MIFKNEQDKQDAITHLPSLKDHPAWKYIIRALDENVATLTKTLLTRKDFTSVNEVNYLQDHISDIEDFKTLPDTLYKEAIDKPVEQESDDVYDELPPQNS